ncbi:MAG: CapA family protein [Nocardioidaceae bacterium]
MGDIMLGRRVGQVSAASGDVSAALRPTQQRLAAADITVGNLESTLSRAGAPRQGDDSFAADHAVLRGLAAAGFDVLSLANNHTGDYGPRALLQTLRRIHRSPIEGVGGGRDGVEAWRPVVVERHGVRFGFVAFNAIGETPRATPGSPGVAEVRMQPRTGPLNRTDLRRITGTIRRLGQRRADVVVVLPHWGDQYTHQPVPAQRRVGRFLVDAGADIVVGGHPHWVQRVQTYRGRLIVHSLGNFVFDMDFSRRTQQGVTADLVFVGDTLRSVRFTPYVIGEDFAPRVVGGRRGARIREPLGVPARVVLSR